MDHLPDNLKVDRRKHIRGDSSAFCNQDTRLIGRTFRCTHSNSTRVQSSFFSSATTGRHSSDIESWEHCSTDISLVWCLPRPVQVSTSLSDLARRRAMWAVNLGRRRTRNQKRRVGQKLSFLDRCWDCCHCNLARNAAKIGCMSSTLGRRPGWHNDKTTPTVPKLKSTKHVDSKAQPWKRRAESHFSCDWTSNLERWAMAKSGFPVCCSRGT